MKNLFGALLVPVIYAVEQPLEWRHVDFASDIYRHAVVVAEADKNIVISPYGVAALFAMLQTGARGHTADGMALALRFEGKTTPSPEAVAKTFRNVRATIAHAATDDVALELSDSIWLKPGFSIRDDFLIRARDAFDAEAHITPMGAIGRDRINAFVSEHTHGRIPKLIDAPILNSPGTDLVAVDTVYLNAKWQTPFKGNATYDQAFHTPSGDIATSFMHSKRHAEILDSPECATLRLPYANHTLEMLILLPSPSNSLADIEKHLSRQYIDSLAATQWQGIANIALPRFRFDSEHDLSKILPEMGMHTAFSRHADFRGLTDDFRDLHIDTAIQKANIEVQENGTVAAAATYATLSRGGAVKTIPARNFVADRPFIFLIREVRTGLILFLGRVIHPTSPKQA